MNTYNPAYKFEQRQVIRIDIGHSVWLKCIPTWDEQSIIWIKHLLGQYLKPEKRHTHTHTHKIIDISRKNKICKNKISQ